jgi:hypothetical protein
VWRLFFVAEKVIRSVSFIAVSKSCAKAFRKTKKRRSAAEKQSIERVFGGLRTDQGRDKLAFRSEIESGLFFRPDSEGRGEY